MSAPAPARVGVLYFDSRDDGILSAQSRTLLSLGYETAACSYEAPLPAGLEVVLATGPYGSLAPLARQLQACPPSVRPALAFLMTEQLPNPYLFEPLRYGLGRLRSRLERLAYRQAPDGTWQVSPALIPLVSKGLRYRYYGDLFWMRATGILSVLAVWSYWTAAYLKERGFEVLVPSRSLNPEWGKDLGLERDIPVLWMGKIGSGRRRRNLRNLRQELRQMGIELLVIDGVDHPYVFGHERTELLNRTRIVLNLLREPWDDNSLRFSLAAANRALIVSEPMLPHSLFRPGQHLVEAPLDRLAETIGWYLEHEDERAALAEAAYQLIARQPPGQGLREIVEAALKKRREGQDRAHA